MRLSLIGLLFLLGSFHSAQAQGVKIYKGDATSTDTSIREFIKVRPLAEGGLVYMGQADEGSDANVSLTKTNPDGSIAWQKVYQATGLDVAKNFIINSNGSYTVVGSTDNTDDLSDPSDIMILKINKNGEIKWAKRFGGSDDDEGFGVSELSNGDLIITGTTFSFGSVDKSAYAARIDTTSGSVLWSKAYSQGRFNYFLNAVTLPGEEAILCGYSWVLGGGNTTLFDPFFVKVGSDGNILWAHRLKIPSSQIIYDFEKDTDGGVVYAGVSSIPAGSNQNLIGKINGQGQHQWTKLVGNPNGDRIWDLTLLPTGEYLVAGFNDKDNTAQPKRNGFVARLTSQGDVAQAISYGVGDTNTTTFTGIALEGQYATATGLTYMYGNSRGAALSTRLLWSDLMQNCEANALPMSASTLSATDSSGAVETDGGQSTDFDVSTISNNLEVIDICSFTSKAETENLAGFGLFPNPVEDKLTLSLPQAQEATIRIYRSTGQQMAEVSTHESSVSILLKDWPQGMYWISIEQFGHNYKGVIVKK